MLSRTLPHRRKGSVTRHLAACCLLIGLLTGSTVVRAVELWSDEENDRSLALDTTLKCTSLLSYAPDDPILYPDRDSAVGLSRIRLDLNLNVRERMNAELAYEHRAQLVSGTAGLGAGAGVLPSFARAYYRLAQLDWQIARHEDEFTYRHELDRALVAFHPAWGEVTLGRQAIGLGRGVLFGAVDIFAPFSPAEVDRDWRRGVDAVRVEYHTSDTSSVELLGAFGESWDDSAVIGRARGYVGDIDGELIVGKRAQDAMIAGAMSAIMWDAEAHIEIAVFHTPEARPEGRLFGDDHLVAKAVLGSSYTFDVGNGLTLLGEYHWSGFGIEDVGKGMARLADPALQERLLRGDTQILGQHALAAQLGYPINASWFGALLVLQSPRDGSGLVSPALAWDITDSTSLTTSAFIPWGARPKNGRLRSEYGLTPISLFAQLSVVF